MINNSLNNYNSFSYSPNTFCLVCGFSEQRVLGKRGNREYSGANLNFKPHVYTNVVKCCKCGFIFCNPAIIGLEWLEVEHYNNPNVYKVNEQQDFFTAFSIGFELINKFKPSGKLLDIGAGKGEFVSFAKKKGYEANGIEPSQRFCDHANKTYGIHLDQGFLGEGNHFIGEKFDVITLFHVLEHVCRPQDLLKNSYNFLKDDGVLYIEVPNADSFLLWIADFVFRLLGKNWSSRLSPLHPPFHSLGYSPKSLKYLLENNNFKIIESRTFSGKVRGYDTSKRISVFLSLARNIVMNIINILPNRELVCVVVKKVN